MPKLKSALIAHQSNAARYAAELKAKERGEAIYGGGAGKKKKSKLAKAQSSITQITSNGLAPKARGQAGKLTEDMVVVGGKGKGKDDPRPRKPTIPFDKSDTILLLGEANFSFAQSLLRPPHNLTGYMILATSYDSEEIAYQKYPDAKDIVKSLRDAGVRVAFGVDAGNLSSYKVVGKGRRWSRVVFNFPHAGAGIKDQDRNILTNQHLLLRTFQSVYPLLTSGPPPEPPTTLKKRKRAASKDDEPVDQDLDLDDDENLDDDADLITTTPSPSTFLPPNKQGTVLITLLDQQPYSLWNLPKLATKPPPLTPGTRTPQPRYTLLRSFEFSPEIYDGYAHRRTIGFKIGKSRDGNEEILGRKGKARTWEFAAKE